LKLFGAMLLALSLALFATGCKKKVAAAPPPPPRVEQPAPPPAPAKPSIATFEAEPSTITKGGDSTLRWTVSGQTTEISIAPGVGTVAANGTRRVFPSNTTVYTLTATGPGGTDTRDVTVNVSQPASAPVEAKPVDDGIRTLADLVNRDVQDAFFDYDKYDIREDARATLTRDADVLKSAFGRFGTGTIMVEGHADERGSAEYNLGLADRRATAARDFLVQLGVDTNRLKTVSYGKERPQCTDANEPCWQKNRRVHFAVQ
jgi:peptidoglycan-associated lipoprotein